MAIFDPRNIADLIEHKFITKNRKQHMKCNAYNIMHRIQCKEYIYILGCMEIFTCLGLHRQYYVTQNEAAKYNYILVVLSLPWQPVCSISGQGMDPC